MADLLKHRYNPAFFEGFYSLLDQVHPGIAIAELNRDIHAPGWSGLELKQRMRRISTSLRPYLPDDWGQTVSILCDLTDLLIEKDQDLQLEYFFLPDMVAQFGLDEVESSCRAMEKLTQYTTSEFAVRPFILQDLEGMMKRMLAWSGHEHHGVRRWSSEGCRPRLPWGMALKPLQQDPSLILPILEKLKADPSAFVRRSVANNLNDISRDHPELVKDIAGRWMGEQAETDALLKHACRGMLKAGDPEVLALFGFASPDRLELKSFDILTPKVLMREDLVFRLEVVNRSSEDFRLRLEYAMHFLRRNGSLSEKVFKLSERLMHPGETVVLEKRHSFRPISTRRYYAGAQEVSLILNGQKVARKGFDLLESE